MVDFIFDSTKEEGVKSFITVNFGPNWDNISITRRYIDEMLYTETKTSMAKNIASAASELMENAFKYSAGGGGCISIMINRDTESVEISVYNVAENNSLENLKKVIEIISKDDPEVMFRNMMLRSFEIGPNNSQLGLAKIRYECNASINSEILDDIPDFLIPFDGFKFDKSKYKAVKVKIKSSVKDLTL